eukprot:1138280-Pelagomonas_calceolata.AAC.2
MAGPACMALTRPCIHASTRHGLLQEGPVVAQGTAYQKQEGLALPNFLLRRLRLSPTCPPPYVPTANQFGEKH